MKTEDTTVTHKRSRMILTVLKMTRHPTTTTTTPTTMTQAITTTVASTTTSLMESTITSTNTTSNTRLTREMIKVIATLLNMEVNKEGRNMVLARHCKITTILEEILKILNTTKREINNQSNGAEISM